MFTLLLISWTVISVALTAPSNAESDNPTQPITNEDYREPLRHESIGSSSFGFNGGQQISSSSSFSSSGEQYKTSSFQNTFGSGFGGTSQHSKDAISSTSAGGFGSESQQSGGRIGGAQETFSGGFGVVGEPTFGGGIAGVNKQDRFVNSEHKSFSTGFSEVVEHRAEDYGKHSKAGFGGATQHAYSNSKDGIAKGGFRGGSGVGSQESFTEGLSRANEGGHVQTSYAGGYGSNFGGSSGGGIGGVQQTFGGGSGGAYKRGGFSGSKMTSFSAGFGEGLEHGTSNEKHSSAGFGGAIQHSYSNSKNALGSNSAAGFAEGLGGALQDSYSGGLRRVNEGGNAQNSFAGGFESSFGGSLGGGAQQTFGGGLEAVNRRGGFGGKRQISFGARFGGGLEHGSKYNEKQSSAEFGGATHAYLGEQVSSAIGLGGGIEHSHHGLRILGGIKGGFGTGLHLLKHVAGTFTGGIGKVFGGALHLHDNRQ